MSAVARFSVVIRIYVFVMTCLITLISGNDLYCFSCPEQCKCSFPRIYHNELIVNCSSAYLTSIPTEIASEVEYLDLANNSFSNVSDFYVLGTFQKLKWLSLKNCGLAELSEDTFCTFLQATLVELQENKDLKIQVKGNTLQCETARITDLSVDAEILIQIKYIPQSVKHLTIHAGERFNSWDSVWKIVTCRNSLIKISIFGKTLQQVPVNLLTDMKNLVILELISCNIRNLENLKGKAIQRNRFELNLSGNNISRLPASILKIFRKTQRVSVDFSYNSISEVDKAAFKEVSKFDSLVFDKNNIGENFYQVLVALQHTKLNNLSLVGCNIDQRVLSKATLAPLQYTDIQSLNLRENRFIEMDADNFYHIPNLQETELDSFVYSVEDSDKSRLDRLKYAHLSNVAGDTGYQLISQNAANNLERMTITRWNTALRPAEMVVWRTCVRMKELYLSDTECGPGFDLRLLTKLQTLSITRTQCTAERIKIPENSQIRKMILNFNTKEIYFVDMFKLFKNMPQLLILNLNNSPFIYKDKNKATSFSSYLPELQELYLSNTNFKVINHNFLNEAYNLKIIDLSHNKLNALPDSLFKDTRKLEVIYLQGNVLQSLDPSILSHISHLQYLDISHNNFHCGCELRRLTIFLQLVRRNASGSMCDPSLMLNIVGMDDTCKEKSKNTQTTSLIKHQIHWIYCDNNLLNFLGTLSFLFLSLIILLTLIVYRFRYSLLILWNHLSILCRSISSQYQYDCYISYCDADGKIVKKLYNSLKSTDTSCILCRSRKFKLCLRDKHFLPGNAIVDNITSHMEASRNILFVLSKEAVKNDWCQFEAEYGNWKYVISDKKQLLVLMIDEIEEESMCVSLRNIIKHAVVIKPDTISCHCGTSNGMYVKIYAVLGAQPGCVKLCGL